LIIFVSLHLQCFSGIGGCHPQILPHQAACQSGCPPGYQCGPYGCTQLRARARAANVFKPDMENEESPDQLFMECCERRDLPKSCLQKCTIQDYTKDALINMYFNRDPCPVSAVAEIQFCAAQGRDHRECCARNGVGTTLAGDKCLVFCDQRPGNVTQLDYSYLVCYDRFDSIKSCFWQDMITRNSLQRFSRHF
uniref:DB domain-containing protein n=1 Tax=Elaeophora elaphi TaxID=1147741 RepID=A0A0R3RLM1_9BILA